MPKFLRQVNQNNWYVENIKPWLAKGDIPADSLKDVQTTKNELSLWLVYDDLSNLERLAAALVAHRNYTKPFDYILFDVHIPDSLGIEFINKPGNTLDDEANNSWHYDLLTLSGAKLVSLIFAVVSNEYILDRFQFPEVVDFVNEGVVQGRIDKEGLSRSFKKRLGESDS